MLNSFELKRLFRLSHALILLALFSLYSCMPTATHPTIGSGNSTNTTGTTTPTYQEPTFPLSGTFIQEGATRSTSSIAIPVDFADSFLIRGKALSVYLRTLPNTTKFCLVGKYTYLSGNDRFLILSAKPKSYTDLTNKTTEFYLQVEPSNDAANQNDCLSYNLTNSLFTAANGPSAHFSFSQLCTNCTTAVTSTALKLYFVNGEQVPSVNVNSLTLTLSGSNGSTVNGCADSDSCKARNFDCCLQSQCVTDGAVKPGALGMSGFESAQEDVRLNPNRFVIYPQYYFVCESRPSDGGSTPTTPTTDPNYEASIRLMELQQLHSCLNKVDGEFSHCTLKFPDAKSSIPGQFSASASGFYDDINFSGLNPALGTGDYVNNIVKIIYAGQTLYQQGSTALTGGTFVAGTANDNLTSSQAVNITSALPTNARDTNLYLTYKVDGTCEKMGSSLAKCSKTYIQSSSDTKSTMWHDSSKTYLLPTYADASPTGSIIVKVSGVTVPEDATTWSKGQSPNRVVFSSSYTIYQNQTVEITYFVSVGVEALIKLRSEAQAKINSMCTCASTAKCNLKPLYNDDNTSIVNYECSYPTSAGTQPPANQTVYVSNKNIAHRYFDQNGVSYDEDTSGALDQEPSAGGKEFNYTSNDVLKPNNLSQYVGFNEIYGSFTKTGTYIAKPAKLVKVKKDQQYDILVNSGAFSSCPTCGSDYYSSLQKIFPQNFAGAGGGYAPDNYESRRENSTSIYRSDDLLYGRACFVPATMIPWTHVTAATPRDQRRSRLAGQHFLFANGYNRDWYGFDYGSLIGSFDGVTWFSIGNQRRIKASTSKLFLAVNAYAGDLNVDSNFNVTVSESSSYSSTIPDHDTETDGAQCQKSHFCSNDNDCFRQLGYDYSCQSVATVSTTWPQFDATGSEVVGSTLRSLLSVVGGSNGQAKRCMYRGRGAPCLPNLDLAQSTNNFNGSSVVGTLTCSPNNSCLSLTAGNKFNDRISRFANTPATQNAASVSPITDTVGMGARIIMRPFEYYGTKTIASTAQSTLNLNNITAVCVPGKDINSASDNYDLNQRRPSVLTDAADKLFGVGVTSALGMSSRALNACPATDSAGNSMQTFDLPMADPILNMFTIQQNLSSNLLDLAPLRAQNIYSSTNGSQITAVGYQRNTCLRAPGASCFSDMECAPSAFVGSKARAADLSALLNPAEVKFWQEDLVCGNPDFKYVASGVLNSTFDVKKNLCCREIGKTLTVFTQTDNSTHQWCDNAGNVLVAGVNTPIANSSRYSRVHTVYDKMTCNRSLMSSTKNFALSLAAGNAVDRMTQILGQYKTLDTLNQRTCCTSHWVRSFATENGGGHAFVKTKMQNIDKGMFKHISWGPDNETTILPPVGDQPFECDITQYTNASCEIKNITPTEEEKYLTWAGSLELIGIPQVAIKTNDQVYKLVSDSQDPIATGVPLTDTEGKDIFLDSTATADFVDGASLRYYSAANYAGMNMTNSGTKNSMKKVFSENEFNCCIPSGQEVPSTTTSDQCCTGFKASNNNINRCCLPDYTDVTVYLNRYVSSEGRGLSDSSYDNSTGYIKDPGQVKQIVAQKNLCCSGSAMTGVAINQMSIPLENGSYKPADTTTTTRRFNYRTDAVDNNTETGSVGSIFDAGVRWNNHIYCVPAGFGQ
jgi:hypothetical protein